MRHAGLLRKSSHALKEGVMLFTLFYLTRIKNFPNITLTKPGAIKFQKKNLPCCTATTFRLDFRQIPIVMKTLCNYESCLHRKSHE